MNEAQTLFSIFFSIIYGFRLSSLRSGTFPIAMVSSKKERDENGNWVSKGVRFLNIAKKRAILSFFLLYACPVLYFVAVFFFLSDFGNISTYHISNFLKVLLLLMLGFVIHGFNAIHTAFLVWKPQYFIDEVEMNRFLSDKPNSPMRYVIGSLPYFIPLLILVTLPLPHFPIATILAVVLPLLPVVFLTLFESDEPIKEARAFRDAG